MVGGGVGLGFLEGGLLLHVAHEHSHLLSLLRFGTCTLQDP